MVKLSEFRQKEVINIHDGRRLGFVYDIELNIHTGHMDAIIVPGNKLFNFFGKDNDSIIPWERITRIGDDIILVDDGL